MPTLNEIEEKRKKGFKKREYRPWNVNGSSDFLAVNIEDQDNDNVSEDDSDHRLEERILFVNPNIIQNWELHDRPINELGDIESLAKEFSDVGQHQPCIVRPLVNNPDYKYELIVGERRWRASLLAGTTLKVIVKNITDSEAAIIQASENVSRKDLSEYARGMSYFKLIEKGILEQKDLLEQLNLSKQQVSRLLSFGKIPERVINAINDMSKISARTAEQIKQLCTKGEMHTNAIIKYAYKLREGKLGHENLVFLVENEIKKGLDNYHNTYVKREKVLSKKGFPLFTWRFDKQANVSIGFSSELSFLLYNKKIDPDELTKLIKEFLDANEDVLSKT